LPLPGVILLGYFNMKQSQLFTKTIKKAPKDEISLNAQYLIRGGFIDKLMAGVYTLLPLGFRVFKKVENIIREEMNLIGGQELFMPTMHPKENWEKTDRWDNMDDLFRFESYYSKTEIALGPTHEEVVAPLLKKFTSSYKDLPKAVYHIQNKFRDEKRAKSGLLRTREFVMKDMYSFHTDQKDLDEYYQKAKKAYNKIFERSGLGDLTHITYASGGTFSKYSHEFQTLTKTGEDTIHVCNNCSVALNDEILADQGNKCPECGSSDLRKEKSTEVGNIFKLGTKFSKPFNLFYTDEKGKEHQVVMGCYGIGLQRLMGTIVEVFNDSNGIIWPETVAPFKVHLLNLVDNNKIADKIYEEMIEHQIEVLYDDRAEKSAGEKFADADLIGIPYRMIVSQKTIKEDSVEIKKRSEDRVELVKIKEVVKRVK